jgi:hypothetical protein
MRMGLIGWEKATLRGHCAGHLAMQRDVNAMIINAAAADYKCARPFEWLCELANICGFDEKFIAASTMPS